MVFELLSEKLKSMILRRYPKIMHPRAVTKQPHTRFSATEESCPYGHEQYDKALNMLVRGAVKDSSNTQYDSRLRTLEKFLRHSRNRDFADALSCTKQEWILYMANWLHQGMGPANGVHSALLQLHQRYDVLPSFLEGKLMWKVTKGASSNFKRVNKGCLSPPQQDDFSRFLRTCTSLDNDCPSCRGKPNVRRRTELAFDVMRNLPIRPDNLKGFELSHCAYQAGAMVGQVFVKDWKTSTSGEWLPLTPGVLKLMLEAYELSGNVFLFPKCVGKHLTDALRESEGVFAWEPGLVYTVHCVRHTCMANADPFIQQAMAAVKKAVARVSATTYDGYTTPVEKRARLT